MTTVTIATAIAFSSFTIAVWILARTLSRRRKRASKAIWPLYVSTLALASVLAMWLENHFRNLELHEVLTLIYAVLGFVLGIWIAVTRLRTTD